MSLSYYARNARMGQLARERMRREGRTPRGHKLWTEREDDICREHYPDYATLRKRLRRRTFRAIKQRCGSLGLTQKRHTWTAAEISRLRRHYPAAPLEELRLMFPDVTLRAIQAAASHRRIRRKRRPFAPTGNDVLDRIRQRCFELRYSMVDLDAMCRSKKYFSEAKWQSQGWINHKAVARAIEALDGEIKPEWRERD